MQGFFDTGKVEENDFLLLSRLTSCSINSLFQVLLDQMLQILTQRVMVIVLQLGLLQWFYGKQFSGPVWVTWIFNFKCDDGALCGWSPISVSDLLPLNNFRCKPGWSSFDTQFRVINRLNDKWAGHQTVGWNVGNFNLKHLVSCLSCSTGQFPNMAAAKRYVINCKLV